MNDEELDLLLRKAPRPQNERGTPNQGPRRAPVWELVVFALVVSGVLAWAATVLIEVFAE